MSSTCTKKFFDEFIVELFLPLLTFVALIVLFVMILVVSDCHAHAQEMPGQRTAENLIDGIR